VADEPPSPERVASIDRVVHPLLGPSVQFEVRQVTRIPFESTGKLRPSRSLVHSEFDQLRLEPEPPAADARRRMPGA
jgi:hypothetical protein